MAQPAFLLLFLLCFSFHHSQQHMLPNSDKKIKAASIEWLIHQMPAGRTSVDPLPNEDNLLPIERDFVIPQDLIFVGEKSAFPGEKLKGDFVFVEEDSISDDENSDSKGERLERDFVLVEEDSIFAGQKSDSTEEKSATTEEKSDSTEEKSSSTAEKSSFTEKLERDFVIVEEDSIFAGDKSDFTEDKSVSTEEKSDSTEEKSSSTAKKSSSTEAKSSWTEEKSVPAKRSDENFIAGKVGSPITDILEQNGLPIGLLPDSVQSFSLSDDGQFEVQLDNTCYAQFDYVVYYGKTVKGKISYGSISNLSGIQAKELFFWVSVTGIRVDIPSSGYVYFDVGPISKRLPMSQFEQIPDCRSRAMKPRSFLRASGR